MDRRKSKDRRKNHESWDPFSPAQYRNEPEAKTSPTWFLIFLTLAGMGSFTLVHTLTVHEKREVIPKEALVSPVSPTTASLSFPVPAMDAAPLKLSAQMRQPLEIFAPENEHEFFEKDEADGITFSWRGRKLESTLGSSYQLEVSRDITFQNVVAVQETGKTTLSNQRLKLQPGKYYWRVKLVDGTKQVEEETPPFEFIYRPRPRLFPPRSRVKVNPGCRFVKDPVKSLPNPHEPLF